MVETAIDSMKTSSADIPIYLVGGGAFLIPDDLNGVSKVYRPKFYDVANAVGAACALVAGSVDTFEETVKKSVGEVQKDVEKRAIERAVEAGSDREKTTIVESEVIPIACEFTIIHSHTSARQEYLVPYYVPIARKTGFPIIGFFR